MADQHPLYDRTPSDPIFRRPALRLPNEGRVAVWLVINVEEWNIQEQLPRTVLPPPQTRQIIPDAANFGWFDYGHRVGVWRLKNILDKHGIRPTVSLNAKVCDVHPEIVSACVDSDWEIMAHGYEQRVLHAEADEASVIRKSVDRIAEFCGKSPRGWLGPGLAETFDTLDILAREGIEYVGDWCNDDQPYTLKMPNGTLVALPYSFEVHDIAMYNVQHHRSDEIYQRGCNTVDQLIEEADGGSRVMCIATHPYITGVPHRSKYFDKLIERLLATPGVVFHTGSEILDWYVGERTRIEEERASLASV